MASQGLLAMGRLLSCWSQPGKAGALKEWYLASPRVWQETQPSLPAPTGSASRCTWRPGVPEGQLEEARWGSELEPGNLALTVVSRETDEEFP